MSVDYRMQKCCFRKKFIKISVFVMCLLSDHPKKDAWIWGNFRQGSEICEVTLASVSAVVWMQAIYCARMGFFSALTHCRRILPPHNEFWIFGIEFFNAFKQIVNICALFFFYLIKNQRERPRTDIYFQWIGWRKILDYCTIFFIITREVIVKKIQALMLSELSELSLMVLSDQGSVRIRVWLHQRGSTTVICWIWGMQRYFFRTYNRPLILRKEV